MKRIITIILNVLLSLSALISTVSASNDYEDNGDFRYIYNDDKSGYSEVLYKTPGKKGEIDIKYPEEYKGKQINRIGVTSYYDTRLEDTATLSINTLYIPKTVEEVWFDCANHPEHDSSVRRITNIRNIVVDKDNPYLCSKDGVLYSKDMKTLCLYPNRNSMTIYKMPDTVKSNTNYAEFYQRNKLKKIYFSDNLKELGEYCAAECKNLEYVYIGTNTKKIEDGAFSGDEKLKTIEIKSKKIKIIDNGVFAGCKSLRDIKLPKSVIKIKHSAFSNCKSLKKIQLPKGLKKLSNEAFNNCKSLKTIEIPDGIKKINRGTFNDCKNLKKVTLPSNLQSISYSAFSDCKKLSRVVIKNKKIAPKISCVKGMPDPTFLYESAFSNTKKGIKFYVKNKKVAKSLKKQLKGSGVRNAKILIGKKVVYKNVK